MLGNVNTKFKRLLVIQNVLFICQHGFDRKSSFKFSRRVGAKVLIMFLRRFCCLGLGVLFRTVLMEKCGFLPLSSFGFAGVNSEKYHISGFCPAKLSLFLLYKNYHFYSNFLQKTPMNDWVKFKHDYDMGGPHVRSTWTKWRRQG